MPGVAVPGLIVIGSMVALGIAGLGQWLRWRAGRPAPVDLLKGIAQWPRRYLVHVHDAVRREPIEPPHARTHGDAGGRRTALMHALTAGGFVAASVLIVGVHIVGLDEPGLAWLLLLALAVMSAGVVFVFLRRVVHGLPSRLLHGRFDRLPWALAAFIVFFAWVTLPRTGLTAPVDWLTPTGLALLGVGAWACLELYAGLGAGPMRHAASGALHLACHPRPGRFARAAAAADAGLAPLDLSAARLGADRPSDFRWNQLIGFDACVECGRCEAACPAHAAGQPLSPRNLIRDLAGAARNGKDASVIGAAVSQDALWSCTTCRACVEECPMMIEHVDAVIDLRRYQTLEQGATPAKAADALETLSKTDTVCGRPLGARVDWAADLDLPRLADVGSCEVLLWVGEGGYELRNQRTLRALVELLRKAGVDVAVLGEEELDSGELARRLGDEATFERLARRNIAKLERYAFESIVTTDPHVLHTLKEEYPALGGRFAIEHHTTLLARLIRAGRLRPGRGAPSPVTYHDPCYLGRYQGELDAPREILAAIGADLREMQRSGRRSSCCGFGGGAGLTDVAGTRRIPDMRVDQARETGAPTVAVACPNCAVMLEGVASPRPDITDVAELLAAAMGSGA